MPLAQIDDDIVRQAQRGDQRAFAAIVRAYEAPVFNYVLRLVRDRGLAEDLTQEIFLRVFQRVRTFSFRSKFTTWLFQVAKYLVLDELRLQERRPVSSELSPLDTHSVADPPAEQRETIDALWRAIGGLNVDLKMALLLREVAGFSYEEIAEILEITLSTVRWRIFEARKGVLVALAGDDVLPSRIAASG